MFEEQDPCEQSDQLLITLKSGDRSEEGRTDSFKVKVVHRRAVGLEHAQPLRLAVAERASVGRRAHAKVRVARPVRKLVEVGWKVGLGSDGLVERRREEEAATAGAVRTDLGEVLGGRRRRPGELLLMLMLEGNLGESAGVGSRCVGGKLGSERRKAHLA